MYDITFIGKELNTDYYTITILPEHLSGLSGQIGDFELKVKKNKVITTIKSKVIVININPQEQLVIEGAYGFNDEIDKITGELDDTVVFLQDYQSTTPAYYNELGLLSAIRIKTELNKDVIYLYRSMRFCNGDNSIYKRARQLGIIFEKYTDDGINITEQGPFKIDFNNADLSFNIKTSSLFLAPVIKPKSILEKVANILNIRQGQDGFLQTENIYLQPTRTSKRGIYVLGFAKGQNGMTSFNEDIMFTLLDIKKEITRLKPLTETKREVDEEACALCYTCYRSCPHGAIEREKDKDCMKINEYSCYGCDTCISVCPAQAITCNTNTLKRIINKPYKILMCENSADIAYRELNHIFDGNVEIKKIPCSNSIQKSDIYKMLSDTDNKLLILGCINDACRHIDADRKFERVVKEAKKTFDEVGLDASRIEFLRVSSRMKEHLKEIIEQFITV